MDTSPNRWSDLALHPVRIRILRAVAGARRTTRDLAAALPDVPQATLYRHLATLVRAGLIEIAEERRVGGATERVYALPDGGITPDATALAAATRDDHTRWFTAFVSSLLSEFTRYLDREHIDYAADGVGYQQLVLHLSDAELARLGQDLSALLLPLVRHEPTADRTPRLLATVLLPVDPPHTHDPDTTKGPT
ncbi:helix-turn-helix domain-containing protein [Micromonospora peucetia]|uniref:Helix-turn-helix domain-containing protein n=1 Tax=Micromonospora peucetia TaxID=47871 RepID=A0A1C6W203_9ACTN|nr:helix-turn-helix domain-containing protein [Micromonospora peucetia]MCX4391075.1 helix-turn-helix domain-containing protein [Micromonospora peucetia]WSA32000.1 helix-turn-helix domain-containing protein [Micromonospora peucetia]SCL72542.1 Helix-turn-helix domain-containing protein [Micromonospora peucetia]